MQTGIFGGSFDPIHTGHLILAQSLISDLSLDRILFIPTCIPPHKESREMTPPEYRWEMLCLALDKHPDFIPCRIELDRGGISYTIDTIRALQNSPEYKSDKLLFIMGADSLKELPEWKDPEELVKAVSIVVIRRPGFDMDSIVNPYVSLVRIADAPLIDISSSRIRRMVRMGKPICFLVPERVRMYILEKGLYRK
jgi:nicotinate-nucleotide adenylyltransferase